MTTNIEIQTAKPQNKDYTINIDTGLSILVKTSGSKLWRFRYSFAGKRCLVSLGKYPQVSMKDAKAKQREYLDLLDKGINPSTHKQIQKIKTATKQDFRSVAFEWHTRHYKDKNERYSKLVIQRLEKYIFPKVGRLPIGEIEAPMMFNLVERIQDKGYITTGKCVNSICSMIFRYGVARGLCKRDVTQDYRGMLKVRKPSTCQR